MSTDLKLDVLFLLDALRHEQALLLRLMDANHQALAFDAWMLSSALEQCLTTRRALRDGTLGLAEAFEHYRGIATVTGDCDLALEAAALEAQRDARAVRVNDWLAEAQDQGFVWLDGDTWELTVAGYTHYMPGRAASGTEATRC